MATGRPPFSGENTITLVEALLVKSPIPPTRLNPELPADVERVIAKALEKDKTLRHQSAAELLADLKRLRRDVTSGRVPVAADPVSSSAVVPASSGVISVPTPVAAAGGRASPRRLALGVGAGALLVAAAAGGYLFLRPTPAPALTDKDLLLVADFKNSTGDAVFDEALRQALTISLSQSPFLSLISDQKVRETLRFMGRTGDEPVTVDVAPEVCQRANAKAFIAGSIAAIGSSYAVTLDARNCATSESIASEQVEASSKETVLRSLGTAAAAMRTRLGESLASVQRLDVQLDQATTKSLEALKVYGVAQRTRLKEGDRPALPLYVQATKLDPDFVMAWARVANINFNLRQPAAMREAAQRAYALRERGSQVEQWYVLGTYQSAFLNDQQAAADTYRLWHQAYPRDYVPANNLSVTLRVLGRNEEALKMAQEALRLQDSPNPTPYNNVIDLLIRVNRPDEIIAVSDEAYSKRVPIGRGPRVALAVSRGDDAMMAREIDATPPAALTGVYAAAANALGGRGRRKEASEMRARQLERLRSTKNIGGLAGALFAEVNAERVDGNAERARTLFAALRQTVPAEELYEIPPIVRNAAAVGDLAFAEEAAAWRLAQWPQSPIWRDWHGPQDRAAIALARGDARSVLTLTDGIQPRTYAGSFVPILRGLAQLQLGNGGAAAAELQTVLDQPGLFPGDQAEAHVGLARAYTLAGDTARARKAYEAFFEFWKRADADVPLLQQAKAEYAKLAP